jgi:alpha-glucosidase (family GH31 glycosyl hydrolase)
MSGDVWKHRHLRRQLHPVGGCRRRFAAPALLATALAPVALAALAAPARAAVTISRKSVKLEVADAGALITRSPFRIAFLNPGGRSVLSEVRNSKPAPKPLPTTNDPIDPGFDNARNAPLYAPLSFTVGEQQLSQYQGLIWGGNLRSGTRSGVRYSARDVLSAKRVGAGMRLVVATGDPSGRRLIVVLRPLGTSAIRLTAGFDRPAGVAMLSDSFASARDEGFFGFGGRHNAIDQHGNLLSSFVEEENVNGSEGFQKGGNGRSLYPNGPSAAYYPQGEFVSSRGYGFLLNSPELARFRMDSDDPTAWNVEVSARSLDYVFAPGSPAAAIRTLTALSGRQQVPPRWALGPMLDRLVKNFGETPKDYQANVAADLANIRRYRLPVTAYRIEGWGLPSAGNDGLALHTYTSPSEQARVIATLRSRGIHPLVYLRPWITPGSKPVEEGLVVRHADGSPYYTTGTSGQPIALLDFTNPAAVRFWQREVAKAFDLGADGFMQDFGEEVLFDMHFHDGETGVTMHNRYLVLYAKATRDEITRYERARPGQQLWFFDRAGYSGLPGTAAYDGGNFPGDETTDWTRSSGIASLTTDMLSRAVTGAYGFGTDIGGYYDLAIKPTSKELFLRWAEWAALSPVFRLHGSGLAGTHTPWSYDRQTVRVYNRLSRLHLRAVPLIMSLWGEADRTGMPVTRPLWLAYPGDRTAWHQDQEWLLGPDVLVAPVVTEGATSRSVYFPAGCWRSPVGKTYRGPRSATVSAPLTDLPYFVRCGTSPLRQQPAS